MENLLISVLDNVRSSIREDEISYHESVNVNSVFSHNAKTPSYWEVSLSKTAAENGHKDYRVALRF